MRAFGAGRVGLALATAVVGLVLDPWADPALAFETVSALKANELAQDGRLTIVDLRSASERSAFGTPIRSVWIEWRAHEQSGEFLSALRSAIPDQRSPIAFICSVGHRSALASRLAEREGYQSVMDVSEGVNGNILGPGWRLWGLPLVPRAD
jgi:rhodanese-related sulfurtransferase